MLLLSSSLSLVEAKQIGINPPVINLEAQLDEKTCQNIIVAASQPTLFTFETRWSARSSYSLEDYSISESEAPLSIIYPEMMLVRNSSVVELCIIPKKGGHYNGVFLASDGNKAAVGTWIVLDSKSKVLNLITGSTINESSSNLLLISPIILLLILTFLIIFSRFRTRRE